MAFNYSSSKIIFLEVFAVLLLLPNYISTLFHKISKQNRKSYFFSWCFNISFVNLCNLSDMLKKYFCLNDGILTLLFIWKVCSTKCLERKLSKFSLGSTFLKCLKLFLSQISPVWKISGLIRLEMEALGGIRWRRLEIPWQLNEDISPVAPMGPSQQQKICCNKWDRGNYQSPIGTTLQLSI